MAEPPAGRRRSAGAKQDVEAKVDPGRPEDPARRALVERAAVACGAGAALLAGWPLAAALATEPEAADDGSRYLDVAAEIEVRDSPLLVPLRTLARDGWSRSERDLGAAWLLRTPGGILALSALCPHLGCAVDRDLKGFFCPCHDSRFDPLGERRSGPSPRGLDPLPAKVEKGRVLVRVVHYATATKVRRIL